MTAPMKVMQEAGWVLIFKGKNRAPPVCNEPLPGANLMGNSTESQLYRLSDYCTNNFDLEPDNLLCTMNEIIG